MSEQLTEAERRESAKPFLAALQKYAVPDATTRPIPLTRGYVAFVDAEDYERVAAFKWAAKISRSAKSVRVYAHKATPGKRGVSTHMHRFILGVDSDVDHIDGDGLNNRRCNLRIANRSQNCANQIPMRGGTSRFKGVSWHRHTGKWQAQIGKDGLNHYLGTFRDEIDAATAYNFAAVELFGEYAQCNRP